MIMGFGFLFMRFAASGMSSWDIHLHWLVLAYLFHTVGELCASRYPCHTLPSWLQKNMLH